MNLSRRNFLASTAAIGFDRLLFAQDAAKTASLELVVEKGEEFQIPVGTRDNHGMILSIVEKAQEQMQEQETKLAAEQKRAQRRIEFTPEETMWYAEKELNLNGYGGIEEGEVLQFITKNPAYKGLAPKKVATDSMELGRTSYAYEDADSQEKLNTLITKKAKDTNNENSSLFQRMMKAKIAKTYGAKKVKIEESQSVLVTNEMVDRFERDASRFYLPGQQIVAGTPEGEKPEPENQYIVDTEVRTESPADLAYALKYVEVRTAYNKITKDGEIPQTEEDKFNMLSQMAGKDNTLSGTELQERMDSLDAKIAELISSENKEYKELEWGEVSIGTESKARGYIAVTMNPEDKKRMKQTAAKYSLSPSEQLVWLRNSCSGYDAAKKEGSMTSEQVSTAIQAIDDKYKGDKK